MSKHTTPDSTFSDCLATLQRGCKHPEIETVRQIAGEKGSEYVVGEYRLCMCCGAKLVTTLQEEK